MFDFKWVFALILIFYIRPIDKVIIYEVVKTEPHEQVRKMFQLFLYLFKLTVSTV